jgi:hypothetical protein
MSDEPKHPSEFSDLVIRPPRPRRRLILGAGATASLILTLANRPALAAKACNHSTWISWKGELTNPSQEPANCTGDSPGTWSSNAASLWAPSWGAAYTTTTKFSTVFPQAKQNPWSFTGTDSLASALQGSITIHQHPTQKLPTTFPAHAVAALLNINFYGDRYGTSSNAQTIAALQTEFASCLPSSYSSTAANNFVSKYSALNTA